MRIALLGTGIMGSGMATNLVAAGHDVVVWNRTRSRADTLAAAVELDVAATPAEAADGADVLVTMLFDADATAATVTGPDGAFAAPDLPAVWVQSATVGDDVARLAALAPDGVAFLDAPVLGTKGPANAGQLVTLVAGDPAGRDSARPALEAWSAKVVVLGDEPGVASRTKLVVNTWLGVLNGGLAELLTVARRLGVDPAGFLSMLEGGALWAPLMGVKGTMMLEGDLEAHFPLVGLRKDVALTLAAADADTDELPTLHGVLAALDDAVDADLGDLDMAAVVRTHEA
jgi:3-hydroxyisobutyrate dehydrogenase